MSSLIEMNEALRRQASHGLWAAAANANHPRTGLIVTLVRAWKRRHTASLLRQLEPRLLDDIGITRGQIDAIAAKAAAKAVARKGTPAMSRFASLAKLPASILSGLTKAWRRQAAIMALERLSNHTLADIGIERGRIAETVDALLAQSTATAAPVRAKSVKVATAKPVEIAVPAHQVAA